MGSHQQTLKSYRKDEKKNRQRLRHLHLPAECGPQAARLGGQVMTWPKSCSARARPWNGLPSGSRCLSAPLVVQVPCGWPCPCPCFTGEDMEAQSREVTCRGSHSEGAKSESEPSTSGSPTGLLGSPRAAAAPWVPTLALSLLPSQQGSRAGQSVLGAEVKSSYPRAWHIFSPLPRLGGMTDCANVCHVRGSVSGKWCWG